MQNVEILQVTATFLNTFGYVGVSLLLLLIAYFFYQRGAKAPFWVTGTIGLSFLVIFGGLDLVTRNFPYLIITRAPLLVGRVMAAVQSEKVVLAANDLRVQRPFVKRENDADDVALANYLFIFAKTGGMSCILLNVSADSQDGEGQFFGISLANMPKQIRPEDELYVRLQRPEGGHLGAKFRWVRGETALTEPADAKALPLGSDDCKTNLADTKPGRSLLERLLPSAFAQEKEQSSEVDPGKIQSLLGSEDPFVRRRARQTIARDTDAAPGYVTDLLQSPDRQVRIGGLDAISIMPPQARAKLGPHVWDQIGALRRDPDASVRMSAERAATAR